MMRRGLFFRAALTLLLALGFVTAAGAATKTFVKDVMLIGGSKSETDDLKATYTSQGWIDSGKDLNKGASGDFIYLLYKTESNNEDANYGYITDFCVYTEGGTAPDELVYDGRTYHLVPFEGGTHFKDVKGDLNSNAGGADIHLYYTKDSFLNYRVVTGISFSNISGSVVVDKYGESSGYDLNKYANGDTIYMYFTTTTVSKRVVTVGDGAYNGEGFPLATDKNYSLTNQFFTKEELGQAGMISSISFHRYTDGLATSPVPVSIEGVKIYMKHYSGEHLMFFSELEDYLESDKVFEGTINVPSRGWFTIELDTPFNYQGDSNIVLCFYDPTPGRPAQYVDFYCNHNRHAVTTVYRRGDNVVPIINSLDDYPEESDYSTLRSDIRFEIGPDIYKKPVDLALSNITTQAATLFWTAPDTPRAITGYAYKYKKVGEDDWFAIETTTATSVTIDNLESDTGYDFMVKTLYGSLDSGWEMLRFYTDPVLPYEYGFENGMGSWELIDHYKGETGDSDIRCHEGSRSFRFRSFGYDHGPQYLVSPRIVSPSAFVVSFYYYSRTDFDSRFEIGYSTTDKDPDSFTWVEEITPTSNWVYYERSFPASTRYIGWKFNKFHNIGLCEVFLDDFTFAESSPYAKPENLAVSDLTETCATLSWTAPSGSPTGYKYQYGKVDGNVWSPEMNETGTSVSLSMLTPNTLYEFRIRACYAGNNVSNVASFRFMTEAPMVTLPYSESFENGMGGWRLLNGTNESCIVQYNVHHGNNSYQIRLNTNYDPQYLISPQFEGSTGLKVSFWASNYMVGTVGSPSIFKLGYSTTTKDLSAFTWSDDYIVNNHWKKFTFDYPSGIKYYAVQVTAGTIFYLDDLRFFAPEQTLTATKATFMGEEKYVTTAYNSAASSQLPSGSVAYTASLDGDDLVFIRIGDGDSNVIPADTPVIIVSDKTPDDGDAQTKDLVLTALDSTDVSAREGNVLHASDTGTAVTDGKIDGKTVYVLGIVNDTLGFYPYSLGAIPARKAYILK